MAGLIGFEAALSAEVPVFRRASRAQAKAGPLMETADPIANRIVRR
jgi:hypothetical protein